MTDLDRLVAEKEGWRLSDSGNVWINDKGNQTFEDKLNFTTDWSLTGPSIEKYGLTIAPSNTTNGTPTLWKCGTAWPMNETSFTTGETPLIAACRAIITIEDNQ